MLKNDKQFNNFKIHTQYSICEGAIKIDDLSDYCKSNKIKSVGICDSYNLCGALEFSEKISKSGTQPIIGTQINFLFDNVLGKIPIFATNAVGYKNLTKLSSKSYLDSNEISDPQCKLEDLLNYSDGLITLSGSQFDLFGSLFKLNKLKQIEDLFCKISKCFKDRFYIEIQRHNEPEEKKYENFLLNLSSKYKLHLIES